MSELKAEGITDPLRDQIINFIRKESKNGLVCSDKKILSNYSDCGEISDFYGDLSGHEGVSDIKQLSGKAGLYFYSTKFMVESYAKLEVMLEEKDLLKIVVSTIRNDCKIYPRPTELGLFKDSPYNIPEEELESLVKIIKSDEMYNDIAFCKTSIDTFYLYSTKYMQKAQAEYLSEWDAVAQYECQ